MAGKRRRGLKSVTTKRRKAQQIETQGEFWAEKILDWGHHDNGKLMYFIKWEGYADEENSWEFEEHVADCNHLLDEFHENSVNGRYPAKYSWQEYDTFCECLKSMCSEKYNDYTVLLRFSNKYNYSDLKSTKVLDDIKSKIRAEFETLTNAYKTVRTNSTRLESRKFLLKSVKRLYAEFETDFKGNLNETGTILTNFFEFVDKRKTINKELKIYESKWNAIIAKNHEGPHISIENNVDIEKPHFFEYITQYKLDPNIASDLKLVDEPLYGCDCDNCYDNKQECCCAVVGFPMVYNGKGLLSNRTLVKNATISFECNDLCKCSIECANRSTQRRRQFPLQIFRTDNGSRGWGVKTLENIPRGAFVSDYCGEIISLVEADRRPTTYLFDLSTHLDTTDVEYTYVVDASKYGNVARFINHSCDPNCKVIFVWAKNYDKHLPIIALFAIKPIRANEELTYDYGMELVDIYCNNYNDDEISTDSGINDGVAYSQISPFGAEVSLDDSNSALNTSQHNHDRKGRVAFVEIECKCGSINCRKTLYS